MSRTSTRFRCSTWKTLSKEEGSRFGSSSKWASSSGRLRLRSCRRRRARLARLPESLGLCCKAGNNRGSGCRVAVSGVPIVLYFGFRMRLLMLRLRPLFR